MWRADPLSELYFMSIFPWRKRNWTPSMRPICTKISKGLQPSLPLRLGSNFLLHKYECDTKLTFALEDSPLPRYCRSRTQHAIRWNHLNRACLSLGRFVHGLLIQIAYGILKGGHVLFRKWLTIWVCLWTHHTDTRFWWLGTNHQ